MTKRGRPIQGAERKRRHHVVIEPRLAEKLRDIGGGNLSAGIARASAGLPELPVKLPRQ